MSDARAAAAGRSAEGSRREANRKFAVGLARAFGGAIFFALPLLMTMEMWWLGFYMDRVRLLVLMLAMVPMLIALDHYSGFEETRSWREDCLDGMIAYGVGLTASLVVLLLLGIVNLAQPLSEVVGKVAIQAVPAGFGAVLANSQLAGEGQDDGERRQEEAGYGAEMLFMVAGAVFVAFNVAPTEEMILISFIMTPWHVLALAVASVAMTHAFVYGSGFRGTPPAPEGTPGWSLFLRFTIPGYALALLVSAYVLWTFGRFDATPLHACMEMTVVLGFPASLGAAAARLIL